MGFWWHGGCETFGRMKTTSILTSKLPLCVALLLLVSAFTGCRTMEGAGEDLENAGESIQDAASDAAN